MGTTKGATTGATQDEVDAKMFAAANPYVSPVTAANTGAGVAATTPNFEDIAIQMAKKRRKLMAPVPPVTTTGALPDAMSQVLARYGK